MFRSALVVLAALLLGACGDSMAFVQDDRITFQAPTELERVTAPFAIEWSDDGRPPAAYAVFVDRDPIAPGDVLPDEADRIHVTDERRVEISSLAPLGGVGGRSPDRVHRATIVLLDGGGRRVGESSWTVEFREAGS